MCGQIFILVCFSFALVTVSDATAQSSQSNPPAGSAAPQSPDQAQATSRLPRPPAAQQDLQWLPGLGQQQTQPANLDPRLAQPIAVNPPPQAQPIAGARRLPTAQPVSGNQPTTNYVQPQSVLANPDELVAVGQQPVIPAAFVTEEASAAAASPQQETGPATPANENVADAQITRVTQGMQHLPNEAGQVWRSYDISPYTNAVANNARPQQALIDWILKETGTDMWFSDPMGILNASRDQLHVYHTPVIQERIKSIVDRFVQSRGQQLVVGLRMMTIGSPNWRASAISLMQPVDVEASGIEAWLMTKENAALLGGMLRARADYHERNNHDLVVVNGQQYTLKQTRPVEFARSIGIVNDGVARYQPLMDRIEQGFTMDFSALTSLDGRSIEALIGVDINQVEGVQMVNVELPTAGGQTQPYQLQIPQMVSWDIRERFRWPSDMVLVVSCGVVATPGPQREAMFGLTSLINGTQGRADALMFVEFKGAAQSLPGTNPATPTTPPAVAGQAGVLQPPPRR